MISRILPILFLVIAAGLLFGYVNPTYTGQIADAKQQIASYDSALVAASQFNQKQNQLIAQENAIPATDIQRIQSFLPDGVDNVQLILDLNSLAARSGLTLSNFAVSQNGSSASSTASGGIGTTVPALNSSISTNSLDLSVSATGTYAAFRTFLAATEQSLRPLDITSISITDSATGVYTYQMTFRIYWLP
ncbi:MAG: hypothetical protein P4M11_05825 [Candidatus Pacebacteria bacterium]|nr:hypothetical protein [Candidatus Paceibacterota bacterium]